MPYFLVLRTPPNVVLALDELLANRHTHADNTSQEGVDQHVLDTRNAAECEAFRSSYRGAVARVFSMELR
jgi:hypothetical protein